MDPEKVRQALLGERERLQGVRSTFDDDGLDASETESLSELSSIDQHQADLGTETFEREKDLSIIEQIEAELHDVRVRPPAPRRRHLRHVRGLRETHRRSPARRHPRRPAVPRRPGPGRARGALRRSGQRPGLRARLSRAAFSRATTTSRGPAAPRAPSSAVPSSPAAGRGRRRGIVLADEERRVRLERQARMYRLSARRAAQWAIMKVKGSRATEAERARLEETFAIRSAQDVAEVLGGMKGAIMKAGQMLSFVADGLPPEAQEALATLQADVPPMAPSLAEGVVLEELGKPAEQALPRLGPDPGGGGVDRPGAPGGHARRPDGGGQGAVPGRRQGHPVRPRQRRAALRHVRRLRPQEHRREAPRRRAAGPHGRRARLPARGPVPGRVRRPLPRATRSSTCPTSSPSAAASG